MARRPLHLTSPNAPAGVESCEPLADSRTGLLGNLELHRPASLLLNEGRAVANSPASEHLIDPQPDEITAPELAVDHQIEHRTIAPATLHLQPYSSGPDIPRFSGRFPPIRRPLFQGTRLAGGERVFVIVSDANPFHLGARSASTGCGRLPRKTRCRDFGPALPSPPTGSRMGGFDPEQSLMPFRGFGHCCPILSVGLGTGSQPPIEYKIKEEINLNHLTRKY